jgi:hypothetical protein
MKNGTAYAEKLKKAFAKQSLGATVPDVPETDEAVRRLAISILGVDSSDDCAERAVDLALNDMADWNEIRVSSPNEINRATGNQLPQGTQKCQRLIKALQSIYDRENRISLDVLSGIGRRESRHYLEELDGVDEYSVASVLLWSLGGHAIPVNDKLLESLRDADLVNPSADRGEVQAFLERHVSAKDAKAFCLIMQSFSPKKQAAASRSGDNKTSKTKKRPSKSL